jgi:selenocysteine lyase/cysteine desulfurase
MFAYIRIIISITLIGMEPLMSNPLIEKIRHSVIGDQQPFETCFGVKPLIYADYTASGRAVDFIEDFIRQQVLPYYANTHTETSFTGAQISALREQARQIILNAVNGNDKDQLIFCGSGATAAINKLIDILNIRLPADLAKRHNLLEQIPVQQRPVVFIGPYEHHSNELPWRESIAHVEVIPLNKHGGLDLETLEQKLVEHRDRELKIGSFSAASNVTGIKTDVDRVSALLHQYGALSFWDYAAAAPYVGIDMNAGGDDDTRNKDAVFISPHKFIGGPGTPGILIVKEHVLNNSIPAVPGGGTVLYVTPEDHQFITDHQRREEGGTPAIVESIRAGLVFKLQQDVGTQTIEKYEQQFIRQALARWRQYDNLEVLGNPDADRLSIVSVRFKHQGKDLHYGFVVALLNDLFGIQARGGCSCAGPYGHALLNMDMIYSKALEAELEKGHMILRPGWVRLNFNYFIDEETFDYLVSAVELIAEHGWRLLPFYCFDRETGTWRYQMKKMQLVSDINTFNFATSEGHMQSAQVRTPLIEHLAVAEKEIQRKDRSGQTYALYLSENAEQLRWFVLPQEIRARTTVLLRDAAAQ